MQSIVGVILEAGRGGIDTALYVLLPIMVVTTISMRILNAIGALQLLCRVSDPVVRPFGLTGLGVLALLQTSIVGFAGPIPVLALMERRGESRRRMAAIFAAILTAAPGNALFPLAGFGVDVVAVLVGSLIASLAAASIAYWGFGHALNDGVTGIVASENEGARTRSILKLINEGGGEAIRIVIGIIPMLILSLALVSGLEKAGLVSALAHIVSPLFQLAGLDISLVVPIVTKVLAGGTALVGVATDMLRSGSLAPDTLDKASAFLIQPLDLPGIAIFASAVPVLGRVALPAIVSATVGIGLRVMLHATWF